MNDSDSFFGSAPIYESRPRSVNPRTGKEQSWQRASNYAAPLDNPHGLIKYQLRELVKGLSLRPDLARMLLTGAAIEDNGKADEIIAQAHSAVALDAKANNGTAAHAALSRSFLGHTTVGEYMPHVNAFAAELKRNGLTPVATEVKILNTLLGVEGHTDWVVKTADGRYLVLDVKTGKLGDAKRKFAVQCKAYGGADFIDDGKNGWIPIPFEIDQTEAILAHLDPETGATALYRVDLVLGLYGATLAQRVRDWHKIEVLSPYVPVHHAIPTTGTLHPEHVESRGTVSQQAVTASGPAVHPGGLVGPREAYAHLADRTEDGQYVVNDVRLQTLLSDARHPDEAHAAHAEVQRRQQAPQTMPGGYQWVEGEGVLRKPTEWLEHLGLTYAIQADGDGNWCRPMTLAEFQQRYPVPEPATNFDVPLSEQNHARMNAVVGAIEVSEPRPASAQQVMQQSVEWSLDRDVIAAEKASLLTENKTKPAMQKIAGEHGCKDLAHNREWLADWIVATRRGADNAAAIAYAKSKGEMDLGSPQVSAPPQASAGQSGDLSFIFKSIEGARSEGALVALRDNIVQRRGDQAWTDEMAEAAARRVNQLLAASGNTVSSTLARIQRATEPQHIAALWHEVTFGGSAEENWTADLKAAAEEQIHRIREAQGSPPPNPYGAQ